MTTRYDGAFDLETHFASIPRDTSGLVVDDAPDPVVTLGYALAFLVGAALLVYGSLAAAAWLDRLIHTSVVL